MKKQLPAYVVLCIIALVAGLLLSATNALTEKRIEEQNRLAAVAARITALPGADAFEELALPEGSSLDAAYRATANGALFGYVAQITVNGYGGEIEIVVGMNLEDAITAINVGGPSFSETAGLGAKAKEEPFTAQFSGLQEEAVLKQNIDSITGATISSGAVVDGVNACRDTLLAFAAADR